MTSIPLLNSEIEKTLIKVCVENNELQEGINRFLITNKVKELIQGENCSFLGTPLTRHWEQRLRRPGGRDPINEQLSPFHSARL